MINKFEIILIIGLVLSVFLMTFSINPIFNYSVIIFLLFQFWIYTKNLKVFKKNLTNRKLLFSAKGKLKVDSKDIIILLCTCLVIIIYGVLWFRILPEFTTFDMVSLLLFIGFDLYYSISISDKIAGYRFFDDFILIPSRKFKIINWTDVKSYTLLNIKSRLDIELNNHSSVKLVIKDFADEHRENFIKFLDDKISNSVQ